MWPDRVSNPEPLTVESDALPIALRGQANATLCNVLIWKVNASAGSKLNCAKQ